MKFLAVMSLLAVISCAQQRHPSTDKSVAYDEMADGKIQATAVKKVTKQDVCFDINLKMKGVEQKEAMASNWTLAWVDQNSRYHLLSLHQRDPASVPKGSPEEWTNSFRTCAPKAKVGDLNSLILTPKELSHKETEGMKLEWN